MAANGYPEVVLLVPFSSEDPSRLRIWQHVKKWLTTTLDYPMYIGEQFPRIPAEYNLSLARNLAAQSAGSWDVAVIHDADTIHNPQQIKDGVAAALETGAVTYPYTERLELDLDGTNMLLEDETSDWQSHITKYTRNQPLGGCIIVRRDLWKLVRGFDSGFVGWGHEDGAFAMACQFLSGKKPQRVDGKSLHLEHTFAVAKNENNPLYKANRARIDKYMSSTKQPDCATRIYNLRNESIATDKKAGITWPTVKIDTKMDAQVALILLADVAKVLQKYGCIWWLSDGTLLGAMRDKKFIKHDDDIDLGVWAESFDIRAIHELVLKYGCIIRRLQGKPDDGMVISLGRAGVHLDLFFYYPISNLDKAKKPSTKRAIYCSMYLLKEPYDTSNKADRLNFICPDFKPLIRHKFMGYTFWVPKNATEHLEAAYGKDWRVPKPNWDTLKDQKNLEKAGIISDMAALQQQVKKYLKLNLKGDSS